jgi:hypothetical protein
MRIGRRSILYGIHNLPTHYFFCTLAYLKLYGLTKEFFDPRLHFVFMFHDLGYWDCKNMDAPKGEGAGELHPIIGALIIKKLFGWEWWKFSICHSASMVKILNEEFNINLNEMTTPCVGNFDGSPVEWYKPSKMFAVDKLASALYPKWLYKFLSNLSGEWIEYVETYYNGKVKEVRYFPLRVNMLIDSPLTMTPEGKPIGTKKEMIMIEFDEWHSIAMNSMKKRAYDFINGNNIKTMREEIGANIMQT